MVVAGGPDPALGQELPAYSEHPGERHTIGIKTTAKEGVYSLHGPGFLQLRAAAGLLPLFVEVNATHDKLD